jgi:hypothetical protein
MRMWQKAAFVGVLCTAAAVSSRSIDAADALPPTVQSFELDVPVAETPTFSREAPPPLRARFGHANLYAPAFFHAVDGSYDLIVHFHGMSSVQEGNIDRAHVNAAIVSVGIGFGSGPYEQAFRDPHTFAQLVATSARIIEKSGRVPDAHLGRVAVTSWSAGYGAVSSLLRQPATVARVDAFLLAEGPHSNYANEKTHVVDDAPLAKFARVAEAAKHGDKLLALTHSSIPTEANGYPSTTETIGELLRLEAVDRVANARTGPRGMRQIYEADARDFHVKGYEGTGVKDHVDHIRAMGETLFPYLKARWDR